MCDVSDGLLQDAGHVAAASGVVLEIDTAALEVAPANAARHGALSQPAARLTVDWRLEHRADGAYLMIDWQETGVTMAPPGPAGYGRELVERALPYQLDATSTLTFGPEGIACRIELPLRDSVRI